MSREREHSKLVCPRDWMKSAIVIVSYNVPHL